MAMIMSVIVIVVVAVFMLVSMSVAVVVFMLVRMLMNETVMLMGMVVPVMVLMLMQVFVRVFPVHIFLHNLHWLFAWSTGRVGTRGYISYMHHCRKVEGSPFHFCTFFSLYKYGGELLIEKTVTFLLRRRWRLRIAVGSYRSWAEVVIARQLAERPAHPLRVVEQPVPVNRVDAGK